MKKTITEELNELYKDYYILNQSNLLGNKGDIIRVVNSREGHCDIIKANGDPHWFVSSIRYCIEHDQVIPFSHVAYAEFHRNLQLESVKQAADDMLNSLIEKNKENREILYTEEEVKRYMHDSMNECQFTAWTTVDKLFNTYKKKKK